MQVKITETTASTALAGPTSRRLFTVPSGQFAGRMLALLQTEDNQIQFAFADKPHLSWSSLAEVTSESADFGFDAVMDANGNVFVAYCERSTNFLAVRKLTFGGVSWSVGDAAYIYNGGVAIAPSITIDTNGRLLVSWSRLASGYFDIQVKTSTDSGQTWGTGPTDIGDTLRTGLSAAASKIAVGPTGVHVVYSGTGSDLFIRSQPLSGGSWSDEFTIASGSGLDDHFDVAVSSDGLLGVVFDAQQLRYREYDGSNWGSVSILDESEGLYPQLKFEKNIPVVIYLSEEGDNQSVIKCSHRTTGTFSAAEILDTTTGDLADVLAYDTISSSYSDLTGAASSGTPSDVYHPLTGSLLKNAGDAVYLGMNVRFRSVNVVLSSVGIGGTVTCSYFDGTTWKAFTPAGGSFNFDTSNKSLLLWADLNSIPGDWQKCSVDGSRRFWVKAEVVSGFSAGPIGSQITAKTDLRELTVGR